jgi:hypothetical protein
MQSAPQNQTMRSTLALTCAGLIAVAVNCGGRSPSPPVDEGGAGTVSADDDAGDHDTHCRCDSDNPLCVERLNQSCEGSVMGCPPTLQGWLTYNNLPHEPNGRASASYGVCDDGTTQFQMQDPLGEGGVIVVFDSESRLVFAGNYIRPICGEPPSLNTGVTCQWCNVLRAGGLSELEDAGAAGEGGTAGTPSDGTGQTYCLVDGDGKLVMPPP